MTHATTAAADDAGRPEDEVVDGAGEGEEGLFTGRLRHITDPRYKHPTRRP
jgi:hypothetical protein